MEASDCPVPSPCCTEPLQYTGTVPFRGCIGGYAAAAQGSPGPAGAKPVGPLDREARFTHIYLHLHRCVCVRVTGNTYRCVYHLFLDVGVA